MTILYLCHRAPYPPDKGLTFVDDPYSASRAEPLSAICAEVELFRRGPARAALRSALALLGRKPLTHAAFQSGALASRVATLAAEQTFDAVVAYCSSMAPYACLVDGVPRLVDLVDVDSAKWSQYSRVTRFPMRSIYALEASRLRAYEGRLDRHFDRIIVSTRQELDLMRSLCPNAHLVAVRNGIDLDYYRIADTRKDPSPTLVFTGQMDYLPNVDGVVDFAHKALPDLRRKLPDVRFIVVGRSPSAPVRALAKLPGVEVTGEVDDIRPYLARAWVFVAPLRVAQGVQNKVLEAMAVGLPVVSTPKVLAGLADGELNDRLHLRVAHDHDQFVEITLGLLRDGHKRRRLAEAARRQIEHSYSWDSNCLLLEETLVSMVKACGEPSTEAAALADTA
jgi:sugar transferase (PEP-CTERM/EpsH1 system associated)